MWEDFGWTLWGNIRINRPQNIFLFLHVFKKNFSAIFLEFLKFLIFEISDFLSSKEECFCRTILYATSLYGMGKIVMAFASFFPKQQHLVHPWVDAVGIVLIIFAMGGIVPCVASFSGDQFPYYQTRMISLFFSIFYASINAGSFFSSIFLPIIRGAIRRVRGWWMQLAGKSWEEQQYTRGSMQKSFPNFNCFE